VSQFKLRFIFQTFVLFYNPTNSNAVQLNALNIDSILGRPIFCSANINHGNIRP
jgi:hypothetical protein